MELIEILRAMYKTPLDSLVYQSIQDFLKQYQGVLNKEKLTPQEKGLLSELNNAEFNLPLFALKETIEREGN
jgi:hypothetical protein